MNIAALNIPEVLLITPDVFADDRGCFMETWNQSRYTEQGFPNVEFVQDNFSASKKAVLRGLHFQSQYPQGKLVQVMQGEVFDVAVDIRVGSPSYLNWVGVHLSEHNKQQLWLPPGFAHGFCVLSDSAAFVYKCTEIYQPEYDMGIRWNDPDIAIDWPVEQPELSAKDKLLPFVAEISSDKLSIYS